MPDRIKVMNREQFAVVVPVKPPARGKSRLTGVSSEHRRDLAEAFARDTVTACLAAVQVGAVLVVTDDVVLAGDLSRMGCAAIPDGVTGDLNASLRLAAAEARRRWPALRAVALCADLPALRHGDLDDALGAAPLDRASFVTDADGVGTTLYTAPYDAFDPRFGPGSREAHLDTGATEIAGTLASLRRDVDDVTDLEDARTLGLGRHSAALLEDPRTQ